MVTMRPRPFFITLCNVTQKKRNRPLSYNDESAGKVKSRRIMPGNPYIKSILCQAAWSAVRVQNSGFSSWFWSHQGHLGKKKAIVAISRKLLKMIYILLEKEQYYDPNYTVKATE